MSPSAIQSESAVRLLRLVNIVPILATVLVLALLFAKTQQLDLEEHDRFSKGLRKVRELDIALNQQFLTAKQGKLYHYDSLVDLVTREQNLKRELEQAIPAFLNEQARSEIEDSLRILAETQQEKRDLLETFKMRNSVFSNSQHYFPTLITKLAAKATADQNQELAIFLENLLRDVLFYNLTPQEEILGLVQPQLDWLANHPHVGGSAVDEVDLQIVAAHVRNLVTYRAQLDAVAERIIDLPTAEQGERIYALYSRFYLQIERSIEIYRQLLYMTFVLLVALILYPLVRWQRTSGVRGQANTAPESRDKEHSANLQEINTMLESSRMAAEQAREAADLANRTKSEFLANMSHEIRTPMNAILGFTEILAGLVTDSQQKEYLSSIRASGRSLLKLINDILDLSKVEAGKFELEYGPVDPQRVFVEMEQMFAPRAAEKGLALQVEIDPDLPPGLVLDEVRLRQILVNLIGNAIKFTAAGHVRIWVQHLYPVADRSKADLVFAVEDTGIGIAAEEQQTIFGAFEQQREQHMASFGGTGLGLAITRRLVEMMGGEISVKSAVGVGSTFRVELHGVQGASADELARADRFDLDVEAVRFAPAVVLVADDVEANREVVRAYLEPYDLTVLEAADGKEAVDLVHQQRPDLVLMDLKMPNMNGMEATDQLKKDAIVRHIPVIALTTSATPDESEQFQALCESYLQKPVGRVELVAELSRFLEHEIDAPTAEAEVEEWSAESMDAANLARLPGLVADLQEQQVAWQELQEGLIIDEVEAFAGRMRELGAEYDYVPLVQWGQELGSQAELFDMEGMRRTLDAFPKQIEELNAITQG